MFIDEFEVAKRLNLYQDLTKLQIKKRIRRDIRNAGIKAHPETRETHKIDIAYLPLLRESLCHLKSSNEGNITMSAARSKGKGYTKQRERLRELMRSDTVLN